MDHLVDHIDPSKADVIRYYFSQISAFIRQLHICMVQIRVMVVPGFYLRIICLNFFSVDSVFLLQGSRFFQHNTAFLIL